MADRERLIRGALWSTAVFNGVAGLALAFPESVGQFFALPLPAPRFYSSFVALFVLLFAGLYAWLARRPVIPRAFIVFAAIGKAGAFTLCASLCMLGEISFRAASGSLGDLVFASIFAWWLVVAR